MSDPLSESIRQKLKNLALKKKRPFDEILRYYAIERFLYRLSLSPYSTRFFLKGGLILKVWDPHGHRATLDIDLLAKLSNSLTNIEAIIREIGSIPYSEDAIRFDTEELLLRQIQIGGGYWGVRASFTALLFTSRIPVLLDIGFDDIIYPQPNKIDYPTLLSSAPIPLLGYTLETVVAEKFESIAKLGLVNTRMKDFYDLWTIFKKESLDLKVLKEAIRKVFAHRGTDLQIPIALTPAFTELPDTVRKWKVFLQALGEKEIDLNDVAKTIQENIIHMVDL